MKHDLSEFKEKKCLIRTHTSEKKIKRLFRQNFQTFMNEQGIGSYQLDKSKLEGPFVISPLWQECESTIMITSDSESTMIELCTKDILKSPLSNLAKIASALYLIAFPTFMFVYLLINDNVRPILLSDGGFILAFVLLVMLGTGLMLLVKIAKTESPKQIRAKVLEGESQRMKKWVLQFSNGQLYQRQSVIDDSIVTKKSIESPKGEGGQKKKRKRKRKLK